VDKFLFNGWQPILRIFLVGILAYFFLILILRISGKRSLSKLNAFDLVVTIALGSTLASLVLDAKVALAEGIVAFAVLVGLQFAVTWSSVRWPIVRKFTTGEPMLLTYRGSFLRSALKSERITEEELLAAVRAAGLLTMDKVDAVVLETDGSISVLWQGSQTGKSSLESVQNVERS
jgi:uncharacterized membrane protein YcaP (DUF421 family)